MIIWRAYLHQDRHQGIDENNDEHSHTPLMRDTYYLQGKNGYVSTVVRGWYLQHDILTSKYTEFLLCTKHLIKITYSISNSATR